jgi:hypothetical protein
MGYSEKYRRKLEQLINQGKTKEERVKLSFKAGYQVLTKPVGDQIRESYDAINKAIEDLNQNDPLFSKKKHYLQGLKKDVPKKYAITKEQTAELQDLINDILDEEVKNY